MKFFIILALCLAFVAAEEPIEAEERAVGVDFLLNTLGLGEIINQIKQANQDGTLMVVAAQLVFAGKAALEQAKPIVKQLIADLKANPQNAAALVIKAVADLKALIPKVGKRGVSDFILNTLGLGDILDELKKAGTNMVGQLISVGSQLLFAGKNILENAKPVFNKLIDDLKNHTGDAVTIVAQAIAALNQVLGSSGKRGVSDFILNTLGLGAIVDELKTAGSNLVGQLIKTGTQLLFAGKQILENAKPVLNKLIDDLKNHTGDAVTIVAQAIAALNQVLGSSGKRGVSDFILNTLGLGDILDELKKAGTNMVGQLISVGSQLLFAGKNILENAKPVFNKLIDDLKNHTGDAVTIVAQAIAALNQVLGNNGF